MSTDETTRLSHALRDRYRIVRELGRGGMATVYLAEDLRHDRKVAVKVLSPDFAATLGSGRFLDEIRIAANLAHPHIMPLHDSGVADGMCYYVMPYSEGESLADRVAREGELPVADAVAVVRELLDALGYAHKHGVVHRDIKPGNVLEHEGHVVIVDFGVAKALCDAAGRTQSDLTAEGLAVGTPAYMAPEQAAADPSVDHRADLYSVGALAYELLAGRPPFVGGTPQSILTRQITEVPAPVESHRRAVSPSLSAWVRRSLEKRPADRWQSAEEMLQALREVDTRPSTEQTESHRVGRAPRPHRVPTFLAGAAVVLIAAVGWRALRPPPLDESGRAVVGIFDNLTGDPTLDPVGYMLQDWLTDGLLQSGLMEVVPTITARQAADYIAQERAGGRAVDPIAQLADETGADVVVSGTLYRDGDDIRIQASVTDARDRQKVRLMGSLDPVTGSRDNVTPLFDQVRQRLLGALATGMNRRLAAQVGVGSHAPTYAAYEALNRGLERYVARDYVEASGLFLRAFELDDTYVVPLVYASLSLRNHGEWARSDSAVAILESRRAELSEYQQYWVDYSRAVLDGHLDQARLAIRRAASLAPESKAAYNWALTANRMGRPYEAREALAVLDPERGSMRGVSRYWFRLIEAAHQIGDHQDELKLVELLEAQFPDERALFQTKVWLYAALGWSQNLRSLFADAIASGVSPEVIAARYWDAAVDLHVHGFADEAQEFARLGVEYVEARLGALRGRESDDTEARDPRLALHRERALLLEVLGEPEEALETFRALMERYPEDWELKAHTGTLLAQLGRISEARDVDRWLESLDVPYRAGEITLARAGIAARLGDLNGAAALVDEAREQGVFWAEVHGTFHLYDALGEHEHFLRSMQPRG